jgi:hypothetical protein
MHRRETTAAALGLGMVLAVVIAAAGIRLGIGIPGLRLVHRITASLEVLVVLWLAWMAWRRPAVQLALALTALLSVVGILAGQNPPPAAAAVNLLGGLALAATFAWILAGRGQGLFRGRGVLALLLASQAALGAWLAIVDRAGVALPAHGQLAVMLAGILGWVALARLKGRRGKILFGLALAAPLAGFTALHYEHSAAAALVHAAAAALLLVTAAYAFARAA